MKKLLYIFIVISVTISGMLTAQPKTNFTDILIQKEINPAVTIAPYKLAEIQNQPVEIYVSKKAMIEAVAIENGKVVYSVITNFIHPFTGGYCAFYEDIFNTYDLSKARITYANGVAIDNTGEQLNFKQKNPIAKVLLIPCMTTSRRNVWAFDFNTGDLIDSAFIPYSSPMLQTPRRVLQLSKTQVLVADQLSNAVQLFDTSGAYIRVYCPAGGVNTNILNNIRDLAFTPTGNIIVSNAGTAGFAQNTVQQFDHYGNFLNTFVSDTVVNSPYNFLYRTNDLLLSCSSGLHDVIKFNKTSGLFLGDFLYAALNFPQQITQLDSGKVAICEFSGVLSGIRIYDSTGVLTDTLKGVTGIRGNWKLPNGNFIVTTGVAVSEVNGVTGSLVRTIVTGYNFTCISVFDPNMITESNESNIEIPSEYKLFNNYPNPFNPTTNIKYQITNNKFVTLKIYDVLGKEVKTLVNENKPAGVYEVTWDASSNSSGVYFYKITAGNFTETKRMLLIK